jgi:hypothetical protein
LEIAARTPAEEGIFLYFSNYSRLNFDKAAEQLRTQAFGLCSLTQKLLKSKVDFI